MDWSGFTLFIYEASNSLVDDKNIHFVIMRVNSPVENKNYLELDFKVFFFIDSCCSDIVHDESNWCHSGIIERFEILKMASKMAVS